MSYNGFMVILVLGKLQTAKRIKAIKGTVILQVNIYIGAIMAKLESKHESKRCCSYACAKRQHQEDVLVDTLDCSIELIVVLDFNTISCFIV